MYTFVPAMAQDNGKLDIIGHLLCDKKDKKVIDKYKAENLANNVNQNYKTYRSEVAEELGYKASRQSDYSKIKERLEVLQKHDRNLGYLLENISKN